MLLLPTPVWVLMTVTTGLALLVVEPSGSARTVGVSALALMVLAGITSGLLEARRGGEDDPVAAPEATDGPPSSPEPAPTEGPAQLAS